MLADEWEEKRLQRTLNDLETQIAEFQKLKQVLVKGELPSLFICFDEQLI